MPTHCVGGVIDENIGNLAKKSESLILEILWIFDFSSNNDSLACGSLFYWFSSDAKSSDDKNLPKFENFTIFRNKISKLPLQSDVGMFQNALKMAKKRYEVRFNVLSKFLFCQLFSLSQDSCLSVSENGLGQTDWPL